jgi:hypothetical protein
MAAVLPCGPDAILDLDLPMFNELSKQVMEREERWTRRDEMAAQQIETLHLLLRAIVQGNSSKRVSLPAFNYPRPGASQIEQAPISHGEMFATMSRR